MTDNITKLGQVQRMVNNLIDGLDLNGTPIVDAQVFCNTPEVLRNLSYLNQVIGTQMEFERRKHKRTRKAFCITVEELASIKLPKHPIGINEFAKHINEVIDLKEVKGISGIQINSKLKEKGILGEQIEDTGKKITITNKTSKEYGIEMVDGEYNGRKYQKVVFTDKGKEFLLSHFMEIMELDEVSATKG